MNLTIKWLALSGALFVFFQNCSSRGFESAPGAAASLGTVQAVVSGPNTLPILVNGCGSGVINKPCVTVTVCTPDTSTCVSIPNIILDTGSTGLRVYRSLLGNVSPTPVASPSGGQLAECYEFTDGSYGFWGGVARADVHLGSDVAAGVPIQVIDQTVPGKPSSCQLGDFATPASAGINGIMGVMSFVQDCGPDCVTTSNFMNMYYSCAGGACTSSTVPLANQVPNPIAYLNQDNNGFMIALPSVPTSGATAIGTLVLGIGTQSNNQPSGVTVIPYDGSTDDEFEGAGMLGGTFNGKSYPMGVTFDSGTNFYNLTHTATLPDCSTDALSGLLCPATTLTLSATIASGAGVTKSAFGFQVMNPTPVEDQTNAVPNLADDGDADDLETGIIVWGLPFFFGRQVWFGLEGKTSSLGSDQLIAY